MSENNNQPVVSGGLITVVAILTILIPLLGLILGVIFMVDENPEKKAAGKFWFTIGIIMTIIPCVCALLFMFKN